MLSLDSPEWARLRHCYGQASDSPEMIRRFLDGNGEKPASDVENHIYGALVHQGSSFPAAYAAVPHVVGAMPDDIEERHFDLLDFVTIVAQGECGVPSELEEDYRAALRRAEQIALGSLRRLGDGLEPKRKYYLLAAVAAYRRLSRLAEILSYVCTGDFATRCPAETCGIELGVDAFGGTEKVVLVGEEGATTLVSPPGDSSEGRAESEEERGLFLVSTEAQACGQPILAAQVRNLAGKAECPQCGAVFPLLPELLDPSEL